MRKQKREDWERRLLIPAGQSLKVFRGVDFQEAKKNVGEGRGGGPWVIVGRIPQERATACMQVCGSGLRPASAG